MTEDLVERHASDASATPTDIADPSDATGADLGEGLSDPRDSAASDDLGDSSASDRDAALGPDAIDPLSSLAPLDRPVLRISLSLEPIALGLLFGTPSTTVTADLSIDSSAAGAVRVSLPAGDEQRDLAGKPTLALAPTSDPAEAPPVIGPLPEILLSSTVTDPSHLRERLAHHLAARLGLPVPRSTYARVTLNGEDLGLYVATERVASPAYLSRAASAEGSLFTVRDRVDLWPWQIASLALVMGSESDRASLDLLGTRLEDFRKAHLAGEALTLTTALAGQVDLPAFTRAMAVDIALGHWSGYGRSVYAYSLHVAPDAKVTFLPENLGASLDPADIPNPWGGGGKLLWLCRLDPECRGLLGDALQALAVTLATPELQAEASALRFLALAELATDPRLEVPLAEVTAAQAAVLGDLAERPGWLLDNLACAAPESVDLDGDGASACDDDCDDDRADVHPGAPEQCNLRDDDCDGVLDDDPACPPCIETDGLFAGSRLVLCHAPRPWAEAHEDCLARGGDLVAITSAEMQLDFIRKALAHQWRNWWLGLSDRETEGDFAWSDGSAVTHAYWNDGEPNDYGGREDCVELTPWGGGRWNDLPCDRDLPYACSVVP